MDMASASRRGLRGRAVAALGAAAMLQGLLLAGSGPALAAEGFIDIKLPYGIAYDLAPIQIEMTAKGGPNLGYRIYDMYKTAVAQGKLADNVKQTIAFTPPRFGWYIVECGSEQDGVIFGAGRFLGATPKYPGMPAPAQGEMRGGWNDEALIGFGGLGLDRTNTRMGFDNADRVLADCKKYGTTLLMQFEGPPDTNHVREWVTRMKGKVKYWEVINEPNLSMGPDRYVEIIKQVYPLVKSIDPEALVIGPDPCGINLGWIEGFYKLGGGKFIDALSVHDYEGDNNIDRFHWNWKLGELRKIMARYGDAEKPIWQTERAIGAISAGCFTGVSQANNITLQRDLLETFGVTNEHNSHYYANVTGYDDVPTFVFSGSGPHPAVLATRTRRAMTLGRKFVEKLDFGPTGNKILLGLRYEGDDGSTVTLRNFGCLDMPLDVGVKEGDSLEVVDAFGNSETVAVKSGKAALTVRQMPIYLRLAKGQQVSVPKLDFGHNVAGEATFTWSGGPTSSSSILTDGIFQLFHDGSPWVNTWGGRYAGKVFNEKPETLEIAFDTPRLIESLLIFSGYADNPHCALLDYDLQYHDGKGWVTLEEVRTPCPPSDVVSTYMCKVVGWYLNNNCFVHQFKQPVKTDKLRLVVRRITRGFIPDMIAEKAMALSWKVASEALELREIEVYGPPPPVEISAAINGIAAGQGIERQPVAVTVTNRTNAPLTATAKAEVPTEWGVQPSEMTFVVAEGKAETKHMEVLIPPEVVPGEAQVKLTLVDGKGQPLCYGRLALTVPAVVQLTPKRPQGQVLAVEVKNVSTLKDPLRGNVSLFLNSPGLVFVPEGRFGPLKPGESTSVEFKVKDVPFDKGPWTALYVAKAGNRTTMTAMTRWEWQIVGPFPNNGGAGFNAVYEPEKGVDLEKTYTVVGGKTAGWKRAAGLSADMIDLYALLQPNTNVCAYAVTYIKSPTAQKAIISAGSDDGVKMWINGKMVLASDAHRGAAPGQEKVPVDLKEGWNEVLLKITQGDGGWGFYFDLLRTDGQPMPDIVVSSQKPK